MKRFLSLAAVALFLSAPLFAGYPLLTPDPANRCKLDVAVGAGGAVPYDGAGVSGSPGLQASVFVRPWRFLSLGVSVDHQANYMAEKAANRTSGIAPGWQSYASGGHHDTTITQTDSHNVTNNTTVTNVYPPAAPMFPIAAAAAKDTRIQDSLAFMPALRLGWGLHQDRVYPYLMAGYGMALIHTQDGDRHAANKYKYGAGVTIIVDSTWLGWPDWFVNLEASNNASESEVGVFRSYEAGANFGFRFEI